MPFLSRSRTPVEEVAKLRSGLSDLVSADMKSPPNVPKYIAAVRLLMCGSGETPPDDASVPAMVEEACKVGSDLIHNLVYKLEFMTFESRKDAAAIWGAALRYGSELNRVGPALNIVLHSRDLVERLMLGYENPEIALTCGMMLRDCIRNETLTSTILRSPYFAKFFEYMELPTFEIASDAFETFRDLLTKHKDTVATYLKENHDLFFDFYTVLLKSQNYVTRRQTLKLLCDVLLEKKNVNTLVQYIGDVCNLMLIMNLLRDSSRAIQFEAFHLFKVFVANPTKPTAVVDILLKNREKLERFLSDFQTDREDASFAEEKTLLLQKLAEISPS